MKQQPKTKENIKLNVPCKICKTVIFLGDGTIMNGEPYHFECFADNCREQGRTSAIKQVLEIVDDELHRWFKENMFDVFPYSDLIAINNKIKASLNKLSPNKSEEVTENIFNTKQVQTGSDNISFKRVMEEIDRFRKGWFCSDYLEDEKHRIDELKAQLNKLQQEKK